MNETENTPKKTSEPPKSAWGISPVETCSMDDIIKKEIKTSKLG